jgi:hypothetical protein
MTTFELYRDEGRNFRSVRANIDDDKFVIDTQDMGPVVEEVWGDSDYEFWTTVPREAWGDLLMAFAREFLAENPKATDKLKEICEKHGVEHTWESWA